MFTSTSNTKSSTPKYIACRRGIHDPASPTSSLEVDSEDSSDLNFDEQLNVSSDDIDSLSRHESTESLHEQGQYLDAISKDILDDVDETPPANGYHLYIVSSVVVVLISLFGIVLFYPNESLSSNSSTLTIDQMRADFPSQTDDLWHYIESGVEDVVQWKRPSVFVFLYKSEAEEVAGSLLQNITKYASCELLDDCSSRPIIVDGKDLGKGWDDHGRLLVEYEPELNKKAVMVLQNLDQLSGNIAQALHFMCDEYYPLVKRSLFIFTVKSDGFKESRTNFANLEALLRDKWMLNEDIFYPLFTRLSSIIVDVLPEKRT